MAKPLRLVLGLAFIILIIAVTWAVVANNKNRKVATTKTDNKNTSTIVGQPVTTTTTTPAPATSLTPGAQTAPTSSPATKTNRSRTRQIIITEESDEDFSASAWASSGTNADGSAWAEAHAE